jgi:hypothetical protein
MKLPYESKYNNAKHMTRIAMADPKECPCFTDILLYVFWLPRLKI